MRLMTKWSGSWLLAVLLPTGTASGQNETPRSLRPFELELHAHWEQLTDTTYGFETKFALVRDLAPANLRATYDTTKFEPFLPPAGVDVGSHWRLPAAAMLPFLRQLHPGARTQLHHDGGFGLSAQGAWACLRALDDRHAEIVLRAHAEFLLAGSGEPDTSSWFTPSQFHGRLTIDRLAGKVMAFQLLVPKARANVDVNIAKDGGVIADIGSIPRLELIGGTFPVIATETKQISERDADRILERAFYPFAAIEWLDLAAARKASLASGKPLHVVTLFGSLADESC